VFISHIHEESTLALALKREIVEVFVVPWMSLLRRIQNRFLEARRGSKAFVTRSSARR
jgi:hypothetical protein